MICARRMSISSPSASDAVGQYLQPTPKHAAVDRFVTPEEFDSYATLARAKGFLLVSSSPLTRSSFHADSDFLKLKSMRQS